MVISRRSFVGGTLAACLVGPSLRAQQGEALVPIEGMEQFDPFPEGFRDGIFRGVGQGAETGGIDYGSEPPPAIFIALATAILRSAPYQCRPIDVAYYFANLRQKIIPADLLDRLSRIARAGGMAQLATPQFLSIFAYDWERDRYYNPVVLGFFNGLGLSAYAGDETPWCAAFANWCISRSRANSRSQILFNSSLRRFGTSSASSGSFRCWGRDAGQAPREGDVIVWAKTGTQGLSCPSAAQGHVAFVVGIDRTAGGITRYRVVGGNQGYRGNAPANVAGAVVSPANIAQAVSYRTIGPAFSDRVFHSIRTTDFLR